MINRLIEWSLRNRFLVICGALFLIGWGVRALYRTPVDAIPDLSENQVIVFADWPGRSPQEVEDQVTYPLSVNLQGLAGVKTVRATSMFGFTFITIIFEERHRQLFRAHTGARTLNYLGDQLPAWRGAQARPGRHWPGLGLSVLPGGGSDEERPRAATIWPNCARCRIGSSATSSTPCREWRRSAASAGSSASTRSRFRPHACATLQVSLQDVLEAVQQSNLNVGGKVIEENGMEFVVRGLGLVESAADLENIVLTEQRRHADLPAGRGHRAVGRRFPARRARCQRAGSRRAAWWSCAPARMAWP